MLTWILTTGYVVIKNIYGIRNRKIFFLHPKRCVNKQNNKRIIPDHGRIAAAASLTDVSSKMCRRTIDRESLNVSHTLLSILLLHYFPTPELPESRALMEEKSMRVAFSTLCTYPKKPQNSQWRISGHGVPHRQPTPHVPSNSG